MIHFQVHQELFNDQTVKSKVARIATILKKAGIELEIKCKTVFI